MVMMLAFDPGLSGAIALLNDERDLIEVWDMPTLPRAHGKGNEVNPYLLSDIIGDALDLSAGNKTKAIIELVGSQPRDGHTGAFKFGDSFGVLRGALGVAGIPVAFARPQAWKKAQNLLKKDKSASRALAIEKWPGWSGSFKLVKYSDRAEAALIGDYGLTLLGVEE